jgi:hypothetical protein
MIQVRVDSPDWAQNSLDFALLKSADNFGLKVFFDIRPSSRRLHPGRTQLAGVSAT